MSLAHLYLGTFLMIFTATCLPVNLYRENHAHMTGAFNTNSIAMEGRPYKCGFRNTALTGNSIEATTLGEQASCGANYACTHSVTVCNLT